MDTSTPTPPPAPPPFLHGFPLPPPDMHFYGTVVYVFLHNKRTTPDAIKGLKEVDSGECSICLADAPEERLEMPCGHAFGKECLTHWLEQNNTCPMCRKELPAAFPWFMQLFVPFPAEGEGAPTPATMTPAPSPPLSTPLSGPTSAVQEAPLRSLLRHHPYRPPISPASDCDMGSCGLCTHDGSTVSLECGHTFHRPCLQSALAAGSYHSLDDERVRCELCRQYKRILP